MGTAACSVRRWLADRRHLGGSRPLMDKITGMFSSTRLPFHGICSRAGSLQSDDNSFILWLPTHRLSKRFPQRPASDSFSPAGQTAAVTIARE